MAKPVERLVHAAREGHVEEVLSVLKDNPRINVNWPSKSEFQRTALHAASLRGHLEVIKVLLAHRYIDVNVRSNNGQTPFSFACGNGHIPVVRVLLNDPRVDVALQDNWRRTPLWHAAFTGKLKVMEWLLASGRELGGKLSALEIARKNEKTDAVSMLERFKANPALTRHELRVKLGMLDKEVFALIVFLCDDLLQLKPAFASPSSTSTAAADATRFFDIARRLPMELQMVLCYRIVGSTKQNILHEDSEAAFKSLARILLSQSK